MYHYLIYKPNKPCFITKILVKTTSSDKLKLNEDEYLKTAVKAADKLSALIKCMEEENAGNREFSTAAVSTRKSLEEMIPAFAPLKDFMETFIPDYGHTLDELLGR